MGADVRGLKFKIRFLSSDVSDSVPEGRAFGSNNNISVPNKIPKGRPFLLVWNYYQKIVSAELSSFS